MKKSLLLLVLSFAFIARTLACSVGGTVSGTKTLCSGSASGTLTLSGHTGTIIRWESSVSPFTSWTPIVNTTTTYSSGALIQTTAFRAVVQDGACAIAVSDSSVITIVTTPIKGSITAPPKSCASYMYPNEVLVLTGSTGNVLGWQYAAAPYTSWFDISANPWPPFAPITTTTASVPTPSSSPGLYAYRAILACTDTVNTDSVIIDYKNASSATPVWTGRSTNWYDGANWCWSGGGSPFGGDVSMPAGALFYPVITSTTGTIYVNNLTLDSGSSFQIAAGGVLDLTGSITKHASATFTSAPLGTVYYSNSSSQTISSTFSYGILKINMSSSSAVKNLGNNTSAKMVNLAGGNGLTLNYDLTVDSIITGTGWFNMGAGHLIIKNMGTASGKPTAVFRFWECNSCDACPVTITNNGDVDDFSVRVAYNPNTSYSGETPTGSAITAHSSEKVFFISEAVPGGSNATITLDPGFFSWLGPGPFAVSDKALARWNGSYWVASPFINSPFTEQATNSGITSFGPFIIIDTAASSLLPVEMLSAKAFIKNKDVLVHWLTASELNNDYFEIERSFDNKSFSAIGKVKGAGNSTKIERYAFTDEYAAQLVSQHRVIYYRLKQTDFDGKSSFSAILPVTAEADAMFMINGPVTNPVSGSAKINYTASSDLPVMVKVCDAFGKIVFEQNMSSAKGTNTLDLTVFEQLSSGIYVVTLSQQNMMHTLKLMKQ